MNTADLLADNGRLLYDRATSAAFAAYGRLELHPDNRFEDARQAAAAAYWQAHQTKPHDRYAWTAARYDAMGELLHKSPFTVSLDRTRHDDGDPWIDDIPTPEADPDDEPHWLDDHDLPGLVAQLLKRPSASAVDYQSAILRLLAAGYDNAAIATELDRTEEAIKSTRYKIRRNLRRYCKARGIDTDHIAAKVGGWRPAHHYARMDNTAANAARWGDKEPVQ